MSELEDLPTATVERTSRLGPITFVPFVVAIFVGALLWSAWRERGLELVLRADQGHGIAVGDALVYRGVRVGEVEEIELSESLDELFVHARIAREANGLAREGSRFWVERPRVSLDGIQGLDTLLGGRRIGVLPGDEGGARQTDFVMLPEPPMSEPSEPGGLEFVLEARDRHGLVAGAPILYRGVEIGHVLEVALAPDATQVEARGWVAPRYAELVRERTRFHEVGGLELDAGLFDGVELDLTSLRTFLVGGVALALASEPGPAARSGARFQLHDDPDPDWLEWRPALALGVLADIARPKLLRAELVWREGLFRRKKDRRAWVFPTSSGVVGPADVLVAPDDARDPTLTIDKRRAVPLEVDWVEDGLAHVLLESPPEAPWPVPTEPPKGAPGDCLLIGPTDRPPIAVPGTSLSASGEAWSLDVPVVWDDRWHGACLLRIADSRVLGLCLVRGSDGEVVPLYDRD